MSDQDNQRFEQIARRSLPVVTTFLLVLADVVAWPLPYFGALTPSFGLMGVYYWAIHRPDLFRPSIVFLLGLLQDALTGLPLGLSAFLYVALSQMALSQRRFFSGQIFPMLWFGFALVALVNDVATWGLLWALTGARVSLLPALVRAVFSILVFPLPALLLIRTQRAFLSSR
jgi:rod shape-determining protein MreD